MPSKIPKTNIILFQKHNINIKPAYTSIKFLTTSATKANARKYLTQMLFKNLPAMQIRASLTMEKYHGKYSDELQTTTAPKKTAQYFNIFSIAKPVKTLTLFKILKF